MLSRKCYVPALCPVICFGARSAPSTILSQKRFIYTPGIRFFLWCERQRRSESKVPAFLQRPHKNFNAVHTPPPFFFVYPKTCPVSKKKSHWYLSPEIKKIVLCLAYVFLPTRNHVSINPAVLRSENQTGEFFSSFFRFYAVVLQSWKRSLNHLLTYVPSELTYCPCTCAAFTSAVVRSWNLHRTTN